ncbi:MAG: DUF1674 domain-containing protein [Pseudomonadota bacterium]
MDDEPIKEEAASAEAGERRNDAHSDPQRNFEDLPPAAQRALKEAEERRQSHPSPAPQPKELGGRGGKDPARYGDWEIDGRAVDF